MGRDDAVGGVCKLTLWVVLASVLFWAFRRLAAEELDQVLRAVEAEMEGVALQEPMEGRARIEEFFGTEKEKLLENLTVSRESPAELPSSEAPDEPRLAGLYVDPLDGQLKYKPDEPGTYVDPLDGKVKQDPGKQEGTYFDPYEGKLKYNPPENPGIYVDPTDGSLRYNPGSQPGTYVDPLDGRLKYNPGRP